MLKRWFLYIAVLIGGIIFYSAYQLWFSWLVLLGILFLPVAGLVLSLPAMITLQLSFAPPPNGTPGVPLAVRFGRHCFMPAPQVCCKLRVTKANTGEKWLLAEDTPLPTAHCGRLVCRLEKPVVYDYLGLFHLQIKKKTASSITIWPKPVAVEDVPSLLKHMGKVWRPKVGGGFSEHHEMRLYRPGDKLNQVHWKLSAKTGKTMVREAMEPATTAVHIEMILRGTPEDLDHNFGQMLWLSDYLLEKGITHALRVLTGNGIVLLPVANAQMQKEALYKLLSAPCALDFEVMEPTDASWRYQIGGDRHAS